MSIQERIKIGYFLCNNFSIEFSSLFNEEWIANWHENIKFRIDFISNIYSQFLLEDIFVAHQQLNESIDIKEFCASHLQQPKVFIRVRPNKLNTVFTKLNNKNIEYKNENENCLSFANNIKLEEAININADAVIQDYSSQKIKAFFELINIQNKQEFSVWDCCAASGGKSILIWDNFKNIKLTVSDNRQSIIANLQKRFFEAGIKNYTSKIIDASKQITLKEKFDLIICDVPCTGSGTWGRTPENLFYFNEIKIDEFQHLQKTIATNVLSCLNKEGYFLYITCSVFEKENEQVVDYFQKEFDLEIINKKNIIGYESFADSMFACLLKKK